MTVPDQQRSLEHQGEQLHDPAGAGLDAGEFFRFVREFLDLAKLFRPLLAASRELKTGFEAVCFNERNGLGAQMVAILTAIQPHDTPTDANEKDRRIAGFIDRWYVLCVLEDLPVQPRDIDDLVHEQMVPRLRGCRTVAELTQVLGELVAAETISIMDFTTFGLRANNRRHVRYILARTAAHVDVAVGRADHIIAYLDSDKHHIEHLWANHHERVRAEIPDPITFRTRRNQLGALGLLPGSDNSSINDMTLHEKVRLYGRQNVLLGVLAPTFNERNKTLRDFINDNGLQHLLRRFGTHETMANIVETRQRLYLKLCSIVWDPARLGLIRTSEVGQHTPQRPRTPPGSSTQPGTHHKAKRRTDVARMLNAGVLVAGTEIVLTYRGVDHWASIDADGGVLLSTTGGIYDKVDEAGKVVRGTRTCNGMAEWRVVSDKDERTSLSVLRDQAKAAGRLSKKLR